MDLETGEEIKASATLNKEVIEHDVETIIRYMFRGILKVAYPEIDFNEEEKGDWEIHWN